MKVTAIQSQVKQQGRYSIFIDEKFSFGISELGLINSGIRVGLEVDEAGLQELKDSAAVDKIYNRALGLIARRPRSEWEMRYYLKRKEVKSEVADEILNTLSMKGHINDLEFARAWVNNRRLLKNISARKLSLELRAKRISDEIARAVMTEDETDELEVLKTEIIKKRRQTRYQDNTKLMQYLARQGYRYDDIKTALQDLATDP